MSVPACSYCDDSGIHVVWGSTYDTSNGVDIPCHRCEMGKVERERQKIEAEQQKKKEDAR